MSYTDELWNSETRVFCRLYSLYIYIFVPLNVAQECMPCFTLSSLS